jgi:hypothetical protein
VWHLAKGLYKALTKTAVKSKGIACWQKAIINHLWFSCATCGGCEVTLLKTWASLMNHVRNKHEWVNHKREVERCQHDTLSEEHVEWTKWLTGKNDLLALDKVVKIKFYSTIFPFYHLILKVKIEPICIKSLHSVIYL